MSGKSEHLGLIQGVVNRLATNSFLLKGWSVVLVAGLFALAAKDANVLLIYIAYLPSIAFWALDAYFLWQERLYRSLYDHVRQLVDEEANFTMDPKVVAGDRPTWIGAFTSLTIMLFHGSVVATIVVVMLVLA